MNKQKTKSKQRSAPKPNIAKLADVLDIEFKKIVPLIPLPDGSVVYKDYMYKKKKRKDVKFFGYTDGAHSMYLGTNNQPLKNVDYIKYGYGSGISKSKKTKGYKKEIE